MTCFDKDGIISMVKISNGRKTMVVDVVIKNGKVVSPHEVYAAGIAIDNEKIVSIAKEPHLPKADKVIDAKGKHVLPGLIDPHVHWGHFLGTFEQESKTETQAAANGGITSLIEFLQHKNSYKEIFAEKRKAVEENAIADVGFHFSPVTEQHIEEIPYYAKEFGVCTFKFQMGYKGPDAERLGILGANLGTLYLGYQKIKKAGPIAKAMIHPENMDIVLTMIPRLQKAGRKDLAAWSDARPNICETEHIVGTITMNKEYNVPTYYVHNSQPEGIDLITDGKTAGLEVFSETCPQYLVFSKDNKKLGSLGKVNPPLRTKTEVEGLWRRIAAGRIDCIGSDHCAFLREKKLTLGIWDSPAGVPGEEELLAVMLSEGVNKRKIPIEKVVEICSYNAARFFGLFPRKGTMSVGSDADLVIADMKKVRKVTRDILKGSSDWSLYDGMELKGWPVLTMLRGNIVMEEGEVTGKPGVGLYLHRSFASGQSTKRGRSRS